MLEQILMAAIMLISVITGSLAVFSRSTGTKTWTAAACSGSFVFAAASYLLSMYSESGNLNLNAAVLTTAITFIALAVTGVSFAFAITEVSGVLVPKQFKLTAAVITGIYILFMITMHIHGMGITSVAIKDGAVSGNYNVVLYIVNGIMALLAAAVSGFALSAMGRKLVKVSPAMNALAFFSIVLVICAAAGGFIMSSGLITLIAVLIADILLLVMVRKLDIADILEFGKSCSIDSTNDGVIILDKEKHFLFANRTAKSVFLELSESDPEKLSTFVSTVTESESIKRGDRVFALKKTSYTDYRGDCDCLIVMIHDVTEQELRNSRLNEEAAIDSITGLYNRTKLIDILTETCSSQSGTLLNISFDGFKSINNLYGHEEANKLIASFGTLLRNNTNTDDVRGKLGGELFAVFLKDCTSEGVIAHLTMRLEEQINDALKKQFGASVSVSVGVSVGGVTVPDNGRDYEDLAVIAEEELNKIKDSGGHGYSLRAGNSRGFSESDFVEVIPDSDKPADAPAADSKPAEDAISLDEFIIETPAANEAAAEKAADSKPAEDAISLDELIIETPANNDGEKKDE